MSNQFLDKAIKQLKREKLDAFIFTLSNENLYEFVSSVDNLLIELTGFKGDTAEFLLVKNKGYLLVDGRFTIEAKKEKNDKRIEVVEIDRDFSKIDFYEKVLKKGYRVGINPKTISIAKFEKLSTLFTDKKISLVENSNFLKKEYQELKKKYFYMSSAPLYLLDKKSYTYDADKKIRRAYDKKNTYYITSSLEEIAYITNLRYRFAEIDNHGPLFKAFMIISRKKSYLYISDYLEDEAIKYLSKNDIEVREYKDFYIDLKSYRKRNVILDPKLNNQYVKNVLHIKKDQYVTTPFLSMMSIKDEVEIKNLKKCNIIDGVAITKALYNIKTHNRYIDEYDVMKMVDRMRKENGQDAFLCNSFKTIVAYSGNSAICHYMPIKSKCKKLKDEGLLLIDSGGDYIYGTTDITRTISLYKNKKQIPSEIKKHYTMVLDGMLKLAMQRFPYGTTGVELDIVARSSFYNEYMDFDHGTGHGIGYISNVHEGPNRIGPGIRESYMDNVFYAGQVVSDEPGLYFEDKYGIRIENDLLCVEKKSNKYGDFLGFEILTLCPYDKDLIDKKYLDAKVIPFLESYNKLVYKKISPYLSQKERIWLKEQTCL